MEPTLRPRVKICCTNNVAEARLALRYGADALGLVARMPSGPGEFESILRVTEKYLLSKPSHKLAPFTFGWLLELHREMLGSIWSWAGEIRTTQKNIGVSPKIVSAELGVIAIESEKRHSETGELVIATAAEFHHRAVWVHPFEDGNGRWARLLANIWLMQHDQPVTIWPATDLRDTESPI
ncbi:MAG: Fic family protein [Planctomycetota bacterium]|nr:Fic family protein [Planctomycetota bacterium]